jgi:hypothetical protein
MVYLGGSYQYRGSSVNHEAGRISNGRAVGLSTDAGASWTDMTADATDAQHPNALHPDEHALVVNPNNPLQFFQGGDGGVVRSSGALTDVSANCDSRDLTAVDSEGHPDPAATAANIAECKALLAAVPTEIESINKGLSTLQFQSLSVNPFDSSDLQGGTQDNGTWENYGNPVQWLNRMVGDGGLSGFDVANPHFRFHTFAGAQPDVNFSDGEIADWNWIGDPFFVAPYNAEASEFYFPIVSDPKTSGTMFAGTEHAFRTTTHGMGSMSLADFRAHCNEWTGDFSVLCGDWQPLCNPARIGRLTYGPNTACPNPTPPPASISCPPPYPYGSTRSGGDVAHLERAASDASTLWAATSAGRVFVSKNANAANPADVTFTRIDDKRYGIAITREHGPDIPLMQAPGYDEWMPCRTIWRTTWSRNTSRSSSAYSVRQPPAAARSHPIRPNAPAGRPVPPSGSTRSRTATSASPRRSSHSAAAARARARGTPCSLARCTSWSATRIFGYRPRSSGM